MMIEKDIIISLLGFLGLVGGGGMAWWGRVTSARIENTVTTAVLKHEQNCRNVERLAGQLKDITHELHEGFMEVNRRLDKHQDTRR